MSTIAVNIEHLSIKFKQKSRKDAKASGDRRGQLQKLEIRIQSTDISKKGFHFKNNRIMQLCTPKLHGKVIMKRNYDDKLSVQDEGNVNKFNDNQLRR